MSTYKCPHCQSEDTTIYEVRCGDCGEFFAPDDDDVEVKE